jgi:Ca2+ transporting ATPase
MNYEYEPILRIYGPSRHMTIIFNLFVFLQIYNFVNSRKIEDELNIFEDISRSSWFIAIVLLIIFLQVMIVTLGHRAMSCSIGGLDFTQWMICLAVGSLGLIVSLLTKILTPKEYKISERNQGKHKSHIVPAEAK